MHSCSSTNSPAGGHTSAVHPDIIQTHILTKLDGQSLASASSASSQLNAFCIDEKLWTDICHSTWPSSIDQRVCDTILTFPAGHRSFFSDSFPALDHHSRRNQQLDYHSPAPASELLLAVDIHYDNKLLYSKVDAMETGSEWFLCSPFRVDLLNPKESIGTPVRYEGDETCLSQLDQNLRLSWIMIDPTRKRAVNISSRRPVSVERHWLTDDVHARYVTVVAGDHRHCEQSEVVQCITVVMCGGKDVGELQVREVSLHVQDMDGKSLGGKESLVILQEAMDSGRRKKKKGERGGERERYEKFLEMKRERRNRKQIRERRLDMLCVVTGVSIFMAFWGLILLR